MRHIPLIVSAIFILFLMSLLLPVFECPAHDKSFYGYVVLMIGWIGLIGLDPRWFANPMLLLMLWRLATNRVSDGKFLPVFAAVLAVAAIPIHAAGCEGGGGAPGLTNGLAIGGYLWVAAVLATSWSYLNRATYEPE